MTMANIEMTARRIVLAGGFALAIAAAPALAAFAMPATGPATHAVACAGGEEEDLYTGNCVPHTVPNSPEFNSNAANPDIPEVDGVPCTGGRSSGACIGLSEDAPDFQQPSSTVGSDPTIHGTE
jgi:hypothetical protein